MVRSNTISLSSRMSRLVSHRWLWLAMMVGVVLGGCQCGEEAPEDDEPEVEVVDQQDDQVQGDELREAFGLPLPADHRVIRDQDTWIRVETGKDLDELEQFFIAGVVDAEVVRMDSRLRVVPLRPHSPRAEARHRSGPRSPVVINYRPGPESEQLTVQRPPVGDAVEQDDDEDSQQDDGDVAGVDGLPGGIGDIGGIDSGSGDKLPPLGERPDWLNDIKGEPVEIRTKDGELLAPGAKWGEPYTPPEGSPLHRPIYRHNFGRPFGDWR